MSNEGRFCGSCGAPLNPGARFCGRCGAAAGSPAAQTATPPPPQAAAVAPVAPAETVIGVVPMLSRKKGLLGFSADTFHLVVTSARLIFAQQTSQMLAEDAREANEQAKAEGKGIFGRIGAQMGSRSGKKYLSMPVAAVLAENPGNFFIPLDQVKSAKIQTEWDDDGGPSFDYLIIDTPAGKQKFTMKFASDKDASKLLKQALGNAFR